MVIGINWFRKVRNNLTYLKQFVKWNHLCQLQKRMREIISMDIQILDFSRHIKEELSDEYA